MDKSISINNEISMDVKDDEIGARLLYNSAPEIKGDHDTEIITSSTVEDFSSHSTRASVGEYDAFVPTRLLLLIDKGDFKEAYKRCKRFPNESMQWFKGHVERKILPLHLLCEKVGVPKLSDEKKNKGMISIRKIVKGFQPKQQKHKSLPKDQNSTSIVNVAENNYALDLFRLLKKQFPFAAQLTDENGQLPIHLACQYRAPLIFINELMEIFAEGVTRLDNESRSPLSLAVQFQCHLDVISCLLKAYPGAVDIKDEFGYTPIQMATFQKYFSAVELIDEVLKKPRSVVTSVPRPQITSKELLPENKYHVEQIPFFQNKEEVSYKKIEPLVLQPGLMNSRSPVAALRELQKPITKSSLQYHDKSKSEITFSQKNSLQRKSQKITSIPRKPGSSVYMESDGHLYEIGNQKALEKSSEALRKGAQEKRNQLKAGSKIKAATAKNDFPRLVRIGIGTRSSLDEVAIFPSARSDEEYQRIYDFVLEYSDGSRDGVRIKFHNPCQYFCFKYLPLHAYNGDWIEVGSDDFIKSIVVTYSVRYIPCLFDGLKIVMASGSCHSFGQTKIEGGSDNGIVEHELNFPGPYRLQRSIMELMPRLGIIVLTRDAGCRLDEVYYNGWYNNTLHLLISEALNPTPGVREGERRVRPWKEIVTYLHLMEKGGHSDSLKSQIVDSNEENLTVLNFAIEANAPETVIDAMISAVGNSTRHTLCPAN